MKTKKLNTAIIALLVAFNLTSSVIIITKGCQTIRNQKAVQPNNKAQNFITSLIS